MVVICVSTGSASNDFDFNFDFAISDLQKVNIQSNAVIRIRTPKTSPNTMPTRLFLCKSGGGREVLWRGGEGGDVAEVVEVGELKNGGVEFEPHST